MDAFGPYVTLRSGRYIQRAHLKVENERLDEVVAAIDFSLYGDGGARVVARREIRGVDFAQSNVYQAFDVEFDYDGLEAVEARVFFTGKAKLWLGGISLTRRA